MRKQPIFMFPPRQTLAPLCSHLCNASVPAPLPPPASLAAGEKSLSVTIEEGSENAVWNCFRAKCGWTGGVNSRQGINKAYRQFTNDSGAAAARGVTVACPPEIEN